MPLTGLLWILKHDAVVVSSLRKHNRLLLTVYIELEGLNSIARSKCLYLVVCARTLNSTMDSLSSLSYRLTAPPASTVAAPPPASARIAQHPVSSLLKGRWNEQIEGLLRGAYGWERGLSEWGRKWLYGGPRS